VLTGARPQVRWMPKLAFDIASRLVEDSKKVVNNISVHGREQVMLKVTVAEMQRDVINAARDQISTAASAAVHQSSNSIQTPHLLPSIKI